MSRFRMVLVCVVFFSAGYLASMVLAPKQVEAQVQGDHVYKVVNGNFANLNAANLNSEAKGGWRIVATAAGGNLVIFEK